MPSNRLHDYNNPQQNLLIFGAVIPATIRTYVGTGLEWQTHLMAVREPDVLVGNYVLFVVPRPQSPFRVGQLWGPTRIQQSRTSSGVEWSRSVFESELPQSPN